MDGVAAGIVLVPIAVALQWVVLRVCAGHPALWRQRRLVQVVALVWCVMPLAKIFYVDEIVPPTDGIFHETIAREVAELVSSGQFIEAARYFSVGNNAYRTLLGVFYAATGASEVVTYALNGMLGFVGLLMLLDVMCRHSRCATLPTSVVLVVGLLPSALLWTTANLKEGCILWGICAMLYLTVPANASGRRPPRLLPLIGLLAVVLLRPHIAAAWLAAIGAGAAFDAKRIGLFVTVGAAALASLFMISYLSPDLFSSFIQEGVSTTLSDRYDSLSSNDDLNGAALAGSNPIPILSGLTLILFRPWPYEADDLTAFLVGLEVWMLFVLGFLNWKRIGARRRLLLQPAIVTHLVALLAFGFFFSYMYNMGLAVRQRLMCFPALLFLYFYPFLVSQRLSIQAVRGAAGLQRRLPRFNALARTQSVR